MLKSSYLFLFVFAFTVISCNQQASEETAENLQDQHFELLVDYITGSFSSAKQAAADSAYFDISLEMARIWEDQDAGVWVYVEQAVSSAKNKPYRQRVYQLQKLEDSVFSSTVYSLPKPSRFIGAYTDSVGTGALTPDSLILLSGCDLRLVFDGETFSGKTGDKTCTNNWGEAAYATSQVTVSADQMRSWDQGWNQAGEQVWGAEKGPYIFDKIR